MTYLANWPILIAFIKKFLIMGYGKNMRRLVILVSLSLSLIGAEEIVQKNVALQRSPHTTFLSLSKSEFGVLEWHLRIADVGLTDIIDISIYPFQIKTHQGKQIITLPELTAPLSLDVSMNHLSSLPEEIGKLRNLVRLFLMQNKLNSLPNAIGNLSKLQLLNVDYNALLALPDTFTQLTNLETLSLKNNKLKTVALDNCTQLRALDLSDNPLTAYPDFKQHPFLVVIALRNIRFSDNQNRRLPSLENMSPHLRLLDLNNNILTRLPESIGTFNNLQALYLRGNSLKELPDALGQLVSLQELNLDDNQLTSLPASLGNAVYLSILSLNHNKLRFLPTALGNLRNLKQLFLDHNQLTCLPNNFSNLQLLITLSLAHNLLITLPNAVRHLQKLTHLDLSHNQLAFLPESLDNLSDLLFFFLSNNQLRVLPNKLFTGTTQLTTLDLSNNPFKTLPSSLAYLSNLRVLTIRRKEALWRKATLPIALLHTAGEKGIFVYTEGLGTAKEEALKEKRQAMNLLFKRLDVKGRLRYFDLREWLCRENQKGNPLAGKVDVIIGQKINQLL